MPKQGPFVARAEDGNENLGEQRREIPRRPAQTGATLQLQIVIQILDSLFAQFPAGNDVDPTSRKLVGVAAHLELERAGSAFVPLPRVRHIEFAYRFVLAAAVAKEIRRLSRVGTGQQFGKPGVQRRIRSLPAKRSRPRGEHPLCAFASRCGLDVFDAPQDTRGDYMFHADHIAKLGGQVGLPRRWNEPELHFPGHVVVDEDGAAEVVEGVAGRHDQRADSKGCDSGTRLRHRAQHLRGHGEVVRELVPEGRREGPVFARRAGIPRNDVHVVVRRNCNEIPRLRVAAVVARRQDQISTSPPRSADRRGTRIGGADEVVQRVAAETRTVVSGRVAGLLIEHRLA